MKTPEELNILRTEIESLNRKLNELTEEELTQVTGGWLDSGTPEGVGICPHRD